MITFNIKILSLTIFILVAKGFLFSVYAQITIQNPSFEGYPPQTTAAAFPWQVCRASPDIQPGAIPCFSIVTPYDGNACQGIGAANYTDPFYYGIESFGQVLTTPLTSGKKYQFSIYLSKTPVQTICGGTLPFDLNFEVWGGLAPCTRTKKLAQVDTINHIDWREYSIEFTADANYSFIEFLSNTLVTDLNKRGYLLIDNMSPEITEFPWEIRFTSPVSNTNQSCSFLAEGKMDQPPASTLTVFSKLLNQNFACSYFSADTSWSAQIDYPKGSSGKDTLIVTANFSTKPTEFSSDTLLVFISPRHQLSASINCADSSTTYVYKDAFVQNDSTRSAFWNLGNGTTFSASGKDTSFTRPFTTLENQLVSVTTLTANGCTDSIAHWIVFPNCITTKPELIIPNLITPNGDGKNDYFEILHLAGQHRIELYNRWGEKIYESSAYQNNWQGEDGVYYYLISTEEKIYKGWLQVVR